MGIDFSKLIRSKLPSSHAWRGFKDDKKGYLFNALGDLLKDFNEYADTIFGGIRLKNTSALKDYIKEYNINPNGLTDDEILSMIKSLQVAIGGQSRDYIEHVIRSSGFPQIAVLENTPDIYYLNGNSNVFGNEFATFGNAAFSSAEYNSVGAASPAEWFKTVGVLGYGTFGNEFATFGNATFGSGSEKGYVVTDTLEKRTYDTNPDTWTLYFILTDKDNNNSPLNLNDNQLNLLKDILLKIKPATSVAIINN